MELDGRKIAFIGDSITEGVGVADMANRYDNRLKKILGLKEVFNYGISGSRIAHQSVPSEIPRFDLCFCGRAYNVTKEADVIVIYGGVNDWIHGDAPFGEPSDRTPATFCGAVNFIMQLMKEEYPDVTTVFMTPAHTFYSGMSDKYPSVRPQKSADARPLAEYVKVIENAGRKYGIPVLNLFDELGIDPNNEEESKKYTVDGLHFNDEGHGALAEHLAEFLKAL